MSAPAWLYNLIGAKPLGRNVKVGPEALECIRFASWLRVETLEGRLPMVWFHVANEWAGKARPVFGAVQSQMGKMAGIPDYVFAWDNGGMMIEMKSKTGSQSRPQQLFQKWCDLNGVRYYVGYSFEEARGLVEKVRDQLALQQAPLVWPESGGKPPLKNK